MFLLNYKCIVFLSIIGIHLSEGLNYIDRLGKYELVQPIHLNKLRSKRDLSTLHYETHDIHFDETSFSISGCNRQFKIRLWKNRELLPSKYVLMYQNEKGETVRERKKPENCYYHGEIEGRKRSVVVLSTCNGLSGLLRDEDGEEFFIEPVDKSNNTHVLFNMKDLIISKKATCGHNHTNDEHGSFEYESIAKHFRNRRNAPEFPRQFVETAVVIDNRKYNKWGNVKVAEKKALSIMNFVDKIYKTLNMRVPVVSITIWNIVDLINVQKNPSVTLNEFSEYTKDVLNGVANVYPDNAQLITGINFKGSIIGYAWIDVMCSLRSCGVNQDHSSNPAISANTVAHEMGHNLGFFHNTNKSNCENKPCVMNAYVPGSEAKGFTNSTITKFRLQINNGKFPCLLDYPDKLYGVPNCGNGYKEEGEECDCGTPAECAAVGLDKCCNSTTCELKSGAKCADGACCEDCKFKKQGVLCRDKFHSDCDLQEFCDGTSNECPKNFYLKDGVSCSDDKGYCHRGVCNTIDMQCITLWGEVAMKANDVCFQANIKGDEYGNCGRNLRNEPVPCATGNEKCGKIQCQAKPGQKLPYRPIIGKDSTKDTRKIGSVGCTVGRISFEGEFQDPTLALEGTRCADQSFCIEQKCTNISTLTYLKSCHGKCKNGGVCNNNGHCHCPRGYACPYCEFAGIGGSFDSGQGCIVKDGTSCLTLLTKGLLVFFLLVIPLIIVVSLLVCRYKQEIRECFSSRGKSNKRTRTTQVPIEGEFISTQQP